MIDLVQKSPTRRFIWYWMPVIVYCTIIFVQSSYPTPEKLSSFNISDKMLHVLAYGLLAALVCRASNSTDRWRHRWSALICIGAVVAILYGMSDEWHQSFVEGRRSELSDLMADAVGSVLGSFIYVWLLFLINGRGKKKFRHLV